MHQRDAYNMTEEDEIKALLGCKNIEDLGVYLVGMGELQTDPQNAEKITHLKTDSN
jgi:hypothetical protein